MPARLLYRVAFACSLALYGAAFLAGAVHGIESHGALPALSTDVTTDAQERLARGDVRGAAAQYRIAARIDRGDYGLTKELARILLTIGDHTGEVEQYERARAFWPRDPAVYKALAGAYQRNGRQKDALAAFDAALRLDRGFVDAYVGKGELLLDLGRNPEAAAAFSAALLVDPRRAALHNSLGVALAEEGRLDEARAEFEKAVQLEPSPTYVANRDRAAAGAARP